MTLVLLYVQCAIVAASSFNNLFAGSLPSNEDEQGRSYPPLLHGVIKPPRGRPNPTGEQRKGRPRTPPVPSHLSRQGRSRKRKRTPKVNSEEATSSSIHPTNHPSSSCQEHDHARCSRILRCQHQRETIVACRLTYLLPCLFIIHSSFLQT